MSPAIEAQIARLTAARGSDAPLVSEGWLVSLLAAIADRYSEARGRKESFEAAVVARVHEGHHREFRWSESRKLHEDSRLGRTRMEQSNGR